MVFDKEKEALRKSLDEQKKLAETRQRTIAELGKQLEKKATELKVRESELEEAKSLIEELTKELREISGPPLSYGVLISAPSDDKAEIFHRGQQFRVSADSRLKISEKPAGTKVVLSPQTMAALEIAQVSQNVGVTMKLQDVFANNTALVESNSNEQMIVRIAGFINAKDLDRGSSVVVDEGFLVEALAQKDGTEMQYSSKYMMAEMPDVTFDDIGGLEEETSRIISKIQDPLLVPYLYEAYKKKKEFNLLLYGLPGNGKTTIAKAIARKFFDLYKYKILKYAKGNFIAIRGSEILDKWLGNSEKAIRDPYDLAADLHQKTGAPIIIFWDDAEAIFRQRGTGVSTDVYDSIVTQFTSVTQGVKKLDGVYTIISTNRLELLDPAIVDRMTLKLRIPSPNNPEMAKKVFAKHLRGIPMHPDLGKDGLEVLLQTATDSIFDKKNSDNDYVEVSFENGSRKVFRIEDMLSGRLIVGITESAKENAIERDKSNDGQIHSGMTIEDILGAIRSEFLNNESLPSTEETIKKWLEQLGEKEKVTGFRPLMKDKVQKEHHDISDFVT